MVAIRRKQWNCGECSVCCVDSWCDIGPFMAVGYLLRTHSSLVFWHIDWRLCRYLLPRSLQAFWFGKNTGKEFMPTLDEGSFMLMPTSMHTREFKCNIDYCRQIDRRVSAIPEVRMAVGKWGSSQFGIKIQPQYRCMRPRI